VGAERQKAPEALSLVRYCKDTLPEAKNSGIGGVKLVKSCSAATKRQLNHPSHLVMLDTRLDHFVPTNGEVLLSKY
jgi:hypothetical protein